MMNDYTCKIFKKKKEILIIHNSNFRHSVSNHRVLRALGRRKKKKHFHAHTVIYFLHLLEAEAEYCHVAQIMIPMSDDALYQFQMAARLMQKERTIKSQPLIKHKESNTV